MITCLTGPITHIEQNSITLMVGPMGLQVHVPTSHFFHLKETTTLWTYMHWNQEQGPALYGFQTELDKTTFLLIISCNGIGPKIGLTAIAQLGSNAFLQAITENNAKALSNISGIGAKKAEQIIVQLKHKVQKLIASGVSFEGAQSAQQLQELQEVLASLNYSRKEIDAACNWLSDKHKGDAVTFDLLMRQALSFLAKKA